MGNLMIPCWYYDGIIYQSYWLLRGLINYVRAQDNMQAMATFIELILLFSDVVSSVKLL